MCLFCMNRTIMELRQFYQRLVASAQLGMNRTIMELRRVVTAHIFHQKKYESNHNGIETVDTNSTAKVKLLYESNHNGIETLFF